MYISKIKLKNFRSYKNEIEIDLKKMNILLGKNDIGKSTMLEALDIFFNNGKGTISISYDDINKNGLNEGNENIEITVIFKDFIDEIKLESVPTSLSSEYLLNEDGDLEIKKIYSGKTLKPNTYIIAKHPSNDNFIDKLLIEKILNLQKYVKENNIKVDGKESVSSNLRSAIRKSYGKLKFSLHAIPADKEGAKELWENIQIILPTYTLFQSDRSNTDQDTEIQNPMNIALKNILAEPEIAKKLNEVFEEVKSKTCEVANGTLKKLKVINPELADDLNPKIPEYTKLARAKAFPKTEIESDNVPLNKRGSGVKRIVLLSFFLNEVERRKKEEGLSDVIYAFEEPETSQHPEHQEILISAFKELAKEEGTQIIMTTHSPYVYKNCSNNGLINLISIRVDEHGAKNISNISEKCNLFPHSPTWGEINYFVYNLSTEEFFDELYSRLEELNDTGDRIDIFIKNLSKGKINNNETRIKVFKDGKTKNYNHTYITCIRHQIHHPENTHNIDFKSRLSESIEDMIKLVKSIKISKIQ